MLKFSVVICTKRRSNILARCLSAVSHLNPAPDQVIVVDNTDGDEETERVAREFGARYVIEPKAGLGRARKRGLAECEADAVAYLDDDAVPDTDWLTTQLAAYERKKTPMSITGKVLHIGSPRGRSKSE